MIQSAFTNAYTRQIGAQNQGIGTITQGAKDVGTLAMGIAGFAGGLGEGAAAEAAKHTLAGRVGGIGGNIMLATIEEKRGTNEASQMFSAQDVGKAISSKLGDNPINRTAKKQLSTVFEMLQKSQTEQMLKTSIGDISADSDLGKRIKEELNK